jgi:hypothetical protein
MVFLIPAPGAGSGGQWQARLPLVLAAGGQLKLALVPQVNHHLYAHIFFLTVGGKYVKNNGARAAVAAMCRVWPGALGLGV